MKIKLVFTMDDIIVDDKLINQVTFDWEEDVTQEEISKLSSDWIAGKNFLTSRMAGLTRVKESSLTIEQIG